MRKDAYQTQRVIMCSFPTSLHIISSDECSDIFNTLLVTTTYVVVLGSHFILKFESICFRFSQLKCAVLTGFANCYSLQILNKSMKTCFLSDSHLYIYSRFQSLSILSSLTKLLFANDGGLWINLSPLVFLGRRKMEKSTPVLGIRNQKSMPFQSFRAKNRRPPERSSSRPDNDRLTALQTPQIELLT